MYIKQRDKNIAKSYFFKKKKLFAMREDFVNKNDQQIPEVYFSKWSNLHFHYKIISKK